MQRSDTMAREAENAQTDRATLGPRLFRQLIEQSWVAVEVFDAHARILYAGASTGRILGFAPNETIGANSFDFIHPEDIPLCQGLFQRVLLEGGEIYGRFRMRHQDGSWRRIEGRLLNRLDDPDVRGILASYRDVTDLEEAQRQLVKANQTLQRLAETDGLTGIANRAAFNAHLQTEWRRAARTAGSLALILIDVDQFKLYNDTYGHVAGDECLRRVGQCLSAQVSRAGDMVARYGGEEFVCVLPGASAEGAASVASAMRQGVRRLAILHHSSTVAPIVTISQGVAIATPEPGQLPDSLVESADRALYRAKQLGRDRHQLAEANQSSLTARSSSGCATDAADEGYEGSSFAAAAEGAPMAALESAASSA